MVFKRGSIKDTSFESKRDEWLDEIWIKGGKRRKRRGIRKTGIKIETMSDDIAKRCTKVSNMTDPFDLIQGHLINAVFVVQVLELLFEFIVKGKRLLENTRDALSDHDRAKMSDVKFFRHVWRGVINQCFEWFDSILVVL